MEYNNLFTKYNKKPCAIKNIDDLSYDFFDSDKNSEPTDISKIINPIIDIT